MISTAVSLPSGTVAESTKERAVDEVRETNDGDATSTAGEASAMSATSNIATSVCDPSAVPAGMQLIRESEVEAMRREVWEGATVRRTFWRAVRCRNACTGNRSELYIIWQSPSCSSASKQATINT